MKKILLLLCSVVIFSSCSDDSATNPDDKPSASENYFATTQGSYWIYENEIEDPENGKVVTKDSVALKSVSQKDGKEAYNCDTFTDSDNNGSYETNQGSETFYATAKGKLFIHKDAFLPDEFSGGGFINLGDQIQFKEDWIKIADDSDDDWDIVKSPIEMTLDGLGFTIKGDVDSEGENMKKTKEVSVNGKMVTTFAYKVKINFNGNILTEAFPLPVPIKFSTATTYWIAKGIGPVVIENEGVLIESVLAGAIPPQPGSTATLKTYFIAK